ncbi:MAG: sugar ABC transporter ATP-binding protein [Polyangiaceae bacterium]|nr:sugar ABC transporter ATP-binding protein [Polyangiaceae bacterium]
MGTADDATETSDAEREPVLSVRGLEKAFGGTIALAGVDLEVLAGEVHAVVGENGAGKSTLMKILAGTQQAARGSITLGGSPFAPRDPVVARRAGIALVPQEPELAEHLSVEENVLLGAEPGRAGLVDFPALRARATTALAHVAHGDSAIDPARPAASLGPAERQRVVIARALALASPRVLILDEPTSSLTSTDVEQLFVTLRKLVARGLAVLYVSHFLEEVMAIAHRFTVLRDGRSVATGDIADTTPEALVRAMAGAAVALRPRHADRTPGEVLLSLGALAGRHLPHSATLELHRGEVLGIAGLIGAGRTELLRAIFGLDPVRSGTIRVHAEMGPAGPPRRLAQGVGLLSEDRKAEGLALDLTIAENTVLTRRLGRGPLIDPRRERATARDFVARLGIRCRDVGQRVADLSGGNQQKVALARLLHHDADVLLLDEPTRGIDVRSRADVHAVIDELADRGKAMLVVSSYLPELFALCDRIAVMCRGRLGPSRPARELDAHAILLEAAGG